MTTSVSSTTNSSFYQQLNGTDSTKSASEKSTDSFLKLMVTQLQNQDPLNPTDNAELTSQMAQINTVSGIEKVNESIQSMSSQFVQMQALQGAALVGRNALVEGNKVGFGSDGKGQGSFELAGSADAVKVEVLSSAGRVVGTVDMGAETSGRHTFSWTPPSGTDTSASYTFRVSATSGSSKVTATTYSTEPIRSVTTSGSTLNLELANGNTIAYSKVKAIS